MPTTGTLTFPRRAEQERIVWLDVLRAVAIILVLWGHIFLVGMNDPVTSAVWLPRPHPVAATDYLFGPTTLDRNPLGHWGNTLTARFGVQLGGLGVALFFLVSGFVILLTLDRMRPAEFLLRRALRIFPVCIVAVLLTALATYIYCVSIGVPVPYGFASIFASAFAVNILFQQLPTTPVLWTLTTEIIFYLVMATAATFVRRIGLRAMVAIAALCLAAVFLAHIPAVTAPLDVRDRSMVLYLAELVVYINYMLIGCALCRLKAGADIRRTLLTVIITGASTLAGYGVLGVLPDRHPGVSLADATLALVIFLAAMALKPAGAWTFPLRRVADVSYPLYLIHVPLAWAGLAACARLGLSPTMAGLCSAVLVLAAAWVLHVAVERPSHLLGKRLTYKQRLSRRAIVTS